jgi:hypothetical protein
MSWDCRWRWPLDVESGCESEQWTRIPRQLTWGGGDPAVWLGKEWIFFCHNKPNSYKILHMLLLPRTLDLWICSQELLTSTPMISVAFNTFTFAATDCSEVWSVLLCWDNEMEVDEMDEHVTRVGRDKKSRQYFSPLLLLLTASVV